ncbi:protein EseG [Edwardsiella piscicida]|uniref:protein EseG n=2 Tax=Edwardsiella piscicida TaxID=1263550 RepID=UPI001CF1C773|nr:protein EseG [Edwardsiella piscicida]UCQ38682.1 protein EseG [Edwardsiella piscicida]
MMINGVFTDAPLPPTAAPGPCPAPSRREIGTQCDLLGIEAPRSRAPGASAPLDQLRAQAQEAEQKAKACGVDMAKRSFVAKVLTLVAASAVLITAALITGLTAGAGVPLLALASIGFTIAVGDVACAAYDWNHKKNGGEGLAMGSDAIGNAIHWLGKVSGASDERARQVAAYGSLLARSAITVSTVAVSGFLPVAAPLALQTTIPALTLGRTMIEISASAIKTNETHHGIVQRGHEINAGRAWGRVEIAQSEPAVDRDADERRIAAQLATLEKTRAFLIQTLRQNGVESAPPARRYSFA